MKIYFNPRSRVGNDNLAARSSFSLVNFNPRSRVGNDFVRSHPGVYRLISIHVPAWGTTYIVDNPIPYIDFNPRSRVGNDDNIRHSDFLRGISIHVPAWGTTPNRAVVQHTQSNFNPRSRVGNDFTSMQDAPRISEFQSTFPRGERPWLRYFCQMFIAFQSTFPRGERRLVVLQPLSLPCISIHVPAWGTTIDFTSLIRSPGRISIHVPAWGTTSWRHE